MAELMHLRILRTMRGALWLMLRRSGEICSSASDKFAWTNDDADLSIADETLEPTLI